jgi:hypothetical protein
MIILNCIRGFEATFTFSILGLFMQARFDDITGMGKLARVLIRKQGGGKS